MPIEFSMLGKQKQPVIQCKNCGNFTNDPYLRGLIQRSKRWFWIGPKRDYCAIICAFCDSIKGWESPLED